MHFILIYIEFGYSSNFFYIMKHIEQSIINKVFCSAEMNSAIVLSCFIQFGIRTVDKGKKRTISVDDILENFKNNRIPAFTGKIETNILNEINYSAIKLTITFI